VYSMSENRSSRVGPCGIGLDAYWNQIDGLEERLKDYVAPFASRLEQPGVKVVNLDVVDSPVLSLEVGHQYRREDIVFLFL